MSSSEISTIRSSNSSNARGTGVNVLSSTGGSVDLEANTDASQFALDVPSRAQPSALLSGGIADCDVVLDNKVRDSFHHCFDDGFKAINLFRVFSTWLAKVWRRMFVHASLFEENVDEPLA